MESWSPDGSKPYPTKPNRVYRPAGHEQIKGQRSFYKLRSPIAKLSDLFAHCQEVCHRCVTMIVLES